MKTYRALQTLTIGVGSQIGLTPAQAAPRAQNLKDLGHGRYETLSVVQFKAGEVLGIEGDLPKPHQPLVEAVESDKPDAAAAKTMAAGAAEKDKSRR